jgi:hypothetical protein
MGVEPTVSRVRFQVRARHQTDTTRKLSQIKTHAADCRRVSRCNMHMSALIHGQKADSISGKNSVAPLIAI